MEQGPQDGELAPRRATIGVRSGPCHLEVPTGEVHRMTAAACLNGAVAAPPSGVLCVARLVAGRGRLGAALSISISVASSSITESRPRPHSRNEHNGRLSRPPPA